MKRVYAAGGILFGGLVLIVTLLCLGVFETFSPPDLARWEEGVDPDLAEPPQLEPLDIENLGDAGHVGERLAAMLQERPAAYTTEQARQWAGELMPVIERVSEREFDHPPTIRLADRAEIARINAERLYARYQATLPNLAGEPLRRQIETMAAWESAAYLGMFDPGSRILYLAPTNVRATMDLFEIDEEHFEPFVKLIIAHELTHALQDQVVSAAAPPSVYTPDGDQAYRCVVEGHAVFVADLVGRELGLEETSLMLARRLSAGALDLEDAQLEWLTRTAWIRYEEIYLGGRDFIAHQYEQGGMDRVWSVLANPPANTAMITNPSAYGSATRSPTELYLALKSAPKRLGSDWHVGLQGSLSGLDLHEEYARLEDNARREVVAGIERAWKMTLKRWPGDGRGRLYLIELRGGEHIDPYYAALRDAEGKDPAWTLTDDTELLPGISGDRTRRATYRPADGSGGSWTHVEVRRGLVILHLAYTGEPITDEAIAGMVNEVFERLESNQET